MTDLSTANGITGKIKMRPKGKYAVAALTLASITLFVVFFPMDNRSKSAKAIFSQTEIEMLENGYGKQNHPRLIRRIQERWIQGPSDKPLKLTEPNREDYSQMSQSMAVDKILRHKQKGFFIECGAADGETLSNTLYFEKKLGWMGLLVEANPVYYNILLSKNRKAYSSNVCLSTSGSSSRQKFKVGGLFGGLPQNMAKTHLKIFEKYPNLDKNVDVQCFTLYSLLLAVNAPVIDYFSLDVEGPELEILKTIPFDKVVINVFSIEYRITDLKKMDEKGAMEKLNKLRDFFEKTGLYYEYAIIPNGNYDNPKGEDSKGLDVIFRRKELIL